MKILFDHQMFSMQHYGGISRYFANLYRYLNVQEDIHCQLALLFSRNHYISSFKRTLPLKDKNLFRLNKLYSSYIINKNEFDIFHPTYYSPYFLQGLKKPFVLTVHDMVHELFQEYFSPFDETTVFKRQAITRADHLITVSESTKKDLQGIFNIPDNKISVVHHGYQPDDFAAAGDREILSLPFQHYILYVGDRAAYKNFNRFIKAVQPVLDRYDINLVCAGGGALRVAEQELLYRYGIQNRTKQVSATDAQLRKLYQNALVFVYPSLHEGFGLPILEAFDNDCPVALSNTSCFKEVAGNAAAYFDPWQPENMTHAIETVINDPDISRELKQRGKSQLTRFPMDKCMQNTLEVYHNLV